MKDLVQGFTEQLVKAKEIANQFQPASSDLTFSDIVISGLGGSGIGGRIAVEVVSEEISIPAVCNHHYTIPNFVSASTLFIACSYSGNTEETVEALHSALEKGAFIVCITSGGIIADIAEKNQLPIVRIPSGQPPRSALGYSLVQLLRVLEVYGLIASKDGVIDHVVQLLKKEEEDIKKIAQRLAEKLVDKVPILYSDSDCEGVAVRWRQQLNENAKILCWHHALPEMNHNELVGWAGAKDDVAVVVLRNETDHPRTALRMDISKKIITRYTDNYTELLAKGVSSLERTMYLINIGDWVSVYLAELRKVDPVEVNVIDFLKGSLAGQNA